MTIIRRFLRISSGVLRNVISLLTSWRVLRWKIRRSSSLWLSASPLFWFFELMAVSPSSAEPSA